MVSLNLKEGSSLRKCTDCFEKCGESVKHLQIENVSSMKVEELLNFVEICQQLETAAVGTCKLYFFTNKMQLERQSKKLESLSIDTWPRSDTSVARRFAVAEIKRAYQTLRRLQVMNYSDYIFHQLDDIDTFPRLMALSLQGCHYLYDAELTFILRTTPHVVHLDVGGCVELYDQSGVYIAEQLSQLKTLNMSCTKIKNETMSALAKHHADTLQALNISDCSGVEPDALCEVLQKCTNLRVLTCMCLDGEKLLRDISRRFAACSISYIGCVLREW